MSRLYNRMRGVFRRNRSARETSDSPTPSNVKTADFAVQVDETERNDIDDIRSVTTDNPSRLPPRQGRLRGRAAIDEDSPAAPVNLPIPETRPLPSVTQTDPPPPPNLINTVPLFPPLAPAPTPTVAPINPSPPIPPATNKTRQSPTLDDLALLLERRRQRSFINNPNSQLLDFSRGQHFRPARITSASLVSRPGRIIPASFTPRPHLRSPARAPTPRFEIDYPIENVFVDENIPPSIAVKLNEAVERDRFGRAHHTQHYAYRPKTQHITIGDRHHLECRLVENTPQMGRRYIREIHYPEEQNLNQLQLIMDTPLRLNCYPAQALHFTAEALPNDPMRCY